MAKVCIIGFGCVGSGTYEILRDNYDIISARSGEGIDVKYIVDIRDFSEHEIAPLVTTDFNLVLNDDEISVVIETMGGTELAYTYTKAALERGKSVVTSNKELVAIKGDELFAIAKNNNCKYLYEASVGGGIPIIRPLVTSLCANNIVEIKGILNGTTNYILTKMFTEGTDFERAVSQAQKLGYAERDPSADVDGHDACKKISILSSMVLGKKVNYADVYTDGIRNITLEDTAYAEAVDCVIKLIGKFKMTETGAQVYVAPMLVHKSSLLYGIDDVFNGVMVNGDMLGESLYYGKGAGKHATASAVVSDIMEAVRDSELEFAVPWTSSTEKIISDYVDVKASFLIRIKDKDGAYKKVLDNFDNVKTIQIHDGEFAAITNEITVSELETSLAGIECISKFMFA